MSRQIFAERRVLAKRGDIILPTLIILLKPEKSKEAYYCKVVFYDDKKYDAKIKGADDLNAIECAISYIESICVNSTYPEFLWENGEPMRSD